MNSYTLDFTQPERPERNKVQASGRLQQRRHRVLRRIALLTSGLVCSIAVVGLLRQRTEAQSLRAQYEAQTVRYDSLLTAKIEADRQLEQLRIRLLKNNNP